MKALLKPYWIFVFISMPQVFLLLLLKDTYQIVKTQISEDGIALWNLFFALEISAIVLFSLYALLLLYLRKNTSLYFALVVFVFYVPLIYVYMNYEQTMCPWSIPRWMLLSGEPSMLIYSLLMPALGYALFTLAIASMKNNRLEQRFPSYMGVMAVPVCWYLTFVVLIPLIRDFEFYTEAPMHMIIIIFITSVIIFLLFIIRAIYSFISKRSDRYENNALIAILTGLIFPLAGLTINSGFGNDGFRIFGDFSHPLFFILCLSNGLILIVPQQSKTKYIWPHLLAKMVFLPFSLYFFFVFLPFLPLSVFAIFIFGLGILMLAPLFITVVHLNYIFKDIQLLKRTHSTALISFVAVLCFLVIPVLITVQFYADRITIHNALSELYEKSALEESCDINTHRLDRVLETIATNKLSRRDFGANTPYIDPYYNWLVLDNMSINNAKMDLLRAVFVGDRKPPKGDLWVASSACKVKQVKHKTVYDTKHRLFKTSVELFITNTGSGQQEFATRFYFPKDYTVSNYYLVINGKKEPGILAEKKTAEWVYNQITSFRQDPGLLRYCSTDSLQLNVFPFAQNETRETGFEILHSGNLILNIDGQKIEFTDSLKSNKTLKPIAKDCFVYLPADYISSLPPVKRKPYLHIVVDCSGHGYPGESRLRGSVRELLQSEKEISDSCVVTLVNYQIKHTNQYNLFSKLEKFKPRGGFRLGLALNNILLNNYIKQSNRFPHIVVLSDNIENAVYENTPTALSPERNYFTFYSSNKSMRYSFNGNEMPIYSNTLESDFSVCSYKFRDKTVYVPNVGNDYYYFTQETSKENLEKSLNDQNGVMVIKALQNFSALFPQHTSSLWVKELKMSFESKLLTPNTAYIVTENEAQREVLRQKQKQVMSAKKSMDIEETQQMSEPSFIIFILVGIGLLVIVYFRKKRKLLHEQH